MQFASFVKDEIEEIFDSIDEDGDRSIDFEEFAALLRAMDHAKPDAALRESFGVIDKDRDGRLSFDEFCEWMTRQ